MPQNASSWRAKVLYRTVGDLMPMRYAPGRITRIGRGAFTIRAVGIRMPFLAPRERAKVATDFDGRSPSKLSR